MTCHDEHNDSEHQIVKTITSGTDVISVKKSGQYDLPFVPCNSGPFCGNSKILGEKSYGEPRFDSDICQEAHKHQVYNPETV